MCYGDPLNENKPPIFRSFGERSKDNFGTISSTDDQAINALIYSYGISNSLVLRKLSMVRPVLHRFQNASI